MNSSKGEAGAVWVSTELVNSLTSVCPFASRKSRSAGSAAGQRVTPRREFTVAHGEFERDIDLDDPLGLLCLSQRSERQNAKKK